MDDNKKQNLKDLGFDKEAERIEVGNCATCGSDKTDVKDFRDTLSLREFMISGMCQECQDKVFDCSGNK